MEERIGSYLKELKESNVRIDAKFDKILEEFDETKNRITDIEKQNRQFNIANFIAVASLVIAVIFGLFQLV